MDAIAKGRSPNFAESLFNEGDYNLIGNLSLEPLPAGVNNTQAWLQATALFPELCLLSFPLPSYLQEAYGHRLLAGRRQPAAPWELFAPHVFAMLVAEGKAAIAQHLHMSNTVRLATS